MPIVNLGNLFRRREPWVPRQQVITRDDLADMQANPERRRWREWQYLNPPKNSYSDWGIVMPCEATFWNAFASLNLPMVGPNRVDPSDELRCGAFVKGIGEGDENHTRLLEREAVLNKYVGMRDCLAMSFALDFERSDGDPSKPQTAIAALRSQAKPYSGSASPRHYAAADELANQLVQFFEDMECYRLVDAIACAPPSDPSKPYHHARYLAGKVAESLSKEDASEAMTTVVPRVGLKNVSIDNKLQTLEGTVSIDSQKIHGKTIVLIDDLYQSGITANYTAMLLQEAGAAAILGLACEKTCRNTDNVVN